MAARRGWDSPEQHPATVVLLHCLALVVKHHTAPHRYRQAPQGGRLLRSSIQGQISHSITQRILGVHASITHGCVVHAMTTNRAFIVGMSTLPRHHHAFQVGGWCIGCRWGRHGCCQGGELCLLIGVLQLPPLLWRGLRGLCSCLSVVDNRTVHTTHPVSCVVHMFAQHLLYMSLAILRLGLQEFCRVRSAVHSRQLRLDFAHTGRCGGQCGTVC